MSDGLSCPDRGITLENMCGVRPEEHIIDTDSCVLYSSEDLVAWPQSYSTIAGLISNFICHIYV